MGMRKTEILVVQMEAWNEQSSVRGLIGAEALSPPQHITAFVITSTTAKA